MQLDSTQVDQIATQLMNKMLVDAYITPLFAIAMFVGNAVMWLPEMLIPHKPWRVILLRFFSDDDLKLNKADMKDGTMITLAFWAGKFAIHFGTYDVLSGKDHNELIYQLFGASAIFLGINAFTPRTSKEIK